MKRDSNVMGIDIAKRVWLLFDSRVVDVPRAYNPIVATLFPLQPLLCNGLQGVTPLGARENIRPRNPSRASRNET
jgi:hypothetical protein